MVILTIIPGPLGITVSQTIELYSTPFLPLLWALLRPALVGAATCGASLGVVIGTISSTGWFIKAGFKRPPRGARQALPSFTKRKRSSNDEVKMWKRVLHTITRTVTPGLVLYVGILMQAYLHRRGGDEVQVDEVSAHPLRAVVVVVVGNIVHRGFCYLRTSRKKASAARSGGSGAAVSPRAVDEKLAVAVSCANVPAKRQVKEEDSPV